jgi:hypothetical protein
MKPRTYALFVILSSQDTQYEVETGERVHLGILGLGLGPVLYQGSSENALRGGRGKGLGAKAFRGVFDVDIFPPNTAWVRGVAFAFSLETPTSRSLIEAKTLPPLEGVNAGREAFLYGEALR